MTADDCSLCGKKITSTYCECRPQEPKPVEKTKREQLLLKLQRHYGVRHVMVEGGYITNEDYHKEVIQVVEEVLGITL